MEALKLIPGDPEPKKRGKYKPRTPKTQAQKMAEILGRKVEEPKLNKHEFDERPEHLIDFTFNRCTWFTKKK